MNDSNSRPELFALLIGIDYYAGNQTPDGVRYASLRGCVNDIAGVEKFLRARLQLDDARLFKLTATDLGIAVAEPPEKLPTRKNIIAAFDAVTQAARAGDQVYIHYAGHGGRAATLFPDLKGADGLDESIVPMDIGEPGGNYVRDLEMATLLQRMTAKGLVVTLVLDACHSGGATRGNPNVRVRTAQNGQIDWMPRPADNLVGAPQALQAQWRDASKNKTRGVEAVSGWLPEPRGYVLLAACRANELAAEDDFDGTPHGALTYWLLDALQTMTRETTYALLYNRLVAQVHTRFVSQTPQLEGEMTRTLFGADRLAVRAAINVLSFDAAKNQVRVNVGQAGLVDVGATLAIYPPETRDFGDVTARIALAQITALGGGASLADVTARLDATKPIDAGSQALVLNAGRLDLVRRVALTPRVDGGTAQKQEQALRAASAAIAAAHAAHAAAGEMWWLESADAQASPHYQVSVNARGEYEIGDAGGAPLPHLTPALRIDAPNAAPELVKRLEHLARYHAIVELENYDDVSPLADKLTAQILLPPPTWQRGQKIDWTACAALRAKETLRPGDYFILRLDNRSRFVLNFAVLDLAPDWSVTQILPGADQALATLEPGKGTHQVYRATLADTAQTGTDILKALATTEMGDFRWLELGALGAGPSRGRGAVTPRTALDALLHSVAFPATRGVETTRAASQVWTTTQVQFTTQRA